MVRRMLAYSALALILLGNVNSAIAGPDPSTGKSNPRTGAMEKMIVSHGNVTITLDLDRLRGIRVDNQELKRSAYQFEVGANSFFTIRVFNDKLLRGPDPGSIGLRWGNNAFLPQPLSAAADQLILEKVPMGGPFDLVVRDGRTESRSFQRRRRYFRLRLYRSRTHHEGRAASRIGGIGESNRS